MPSLLLKPWIFNESLSYSFHTGLWILDYILFSVGKWFQSYNFSELNTIYLYTVNIEASIYITFQIDLMLVRY